MKCNVGKLDRVVRIVAGGALLVYAVNNGPWWAWLGIVPLVSGIFAYCPAYALCKINSCCEGKGCCNK